MRQITPVKTEDKRPNGRKEGRSPFEQTYRAGTIDKNAPCTATAVAEIQSLRQPTLV